MVNVSHELRTPLTPIKGVVETLEEDNDDKNRNYLSIIRRNTDRLINIVEDLLALSQLEEKGATLHLDEIDAAKFIEQIHRIFEPKLKEKNLSFTIASENLIPLIRANAFKLEQVFVNIIDNAVKYTEKGSIPFRVAQRNLWGSKSLGFRFSVKPKGKPILHWDLREINAKTKERSRSDLSRDPQPALYEAAFYQPGPSGALPPDRAEG